MSTFEALLLAGIGAALTWHAAERRHRHNRDQQAQSKPFALPTPAPAVPAEEDPQCT